jgi:starch synthase
MGCETAVLASRVGGIPEVVAHNETGHLVDYDAKNAAKFESDFTLQIEELMSNSALTTEMGRAGRIRAEKHFGWDAVAKQTIELYNSLLK